MHVLHMMSHVDGSNANFSEKLFIRRGLLEKVTLLVNLWQSIDLPFLSLSLLSHYDLGDP